MFGAHVRTRQFGTHKVNAYAEHVDLSQRAKPTDVDAQSQEKV
jgi:hypothetical protein